MLENIRDMYKAYERLHKIKEDVSEEMKIHLRSLSLFPKFDNLSLFVSPSDRCAFFHSEFFIAGPGSLFFDIKTHV